MAEPVMALCMGCRDENRKPTMQVMTNATPKTMEGKGGKTRNAMTGVCGKCGTKMFKFVKAA
jgi:hypothetical protein